MTLGEEMVDEGFFSCCFLMFDLLCAFPTCYLILYSPSLLRQYGQVVTGMTAVCLPHLIYPFLLFPYLHALTFRLGVSVCYALSLWS